ncbi:MAG: phenylalanine--tRNA ligase subunit beta [Cytophagales bacterium]|nr:phenylalanine--tRNA ligase subunit beta [Cytophagales bacterium]
MKISLNWLKAYIEINESPEEIAHILTMTGLEVEGIETVEAVKGGWNGVVIGEVLECSKHPNADKLSVTRVDVGNGELLPIVCGAPNVAVGQKVVVARVGTTLFPTGSDAGFKIKKAKIRGELSEGMICAEDELGLGTGHDGIMVLDTNLPNGTAAKEYFELEDDVVFEIGLTPNRADGTSHIGVARDLKAALDRSVSWPDVSDFSIDNTSSKISVRVEDTVGCPRYSGISISNVTIKDSPDWLKTRLLAIGQTPINNVVDVTNFILHELGQPLHGFDADKIRGGNVIVKTLPKDSKFVTLDERERKLYDTDLMICDEQGGMCIAGVFGGTESGVTENTKNIFLESAYFSPDYIRKTSLLHDLKTDSAFRFERGTDPLNTVYALKRAAMLIKQLSGGKISSDIIDIYPEQIKPFRVKMKYKNIDRLIGKSIDRNSVFKILSSLDIQVKDENETGFLAVVPPYRVDVTREADVIEDILRIYGYDNIRPGATLSSDYLADFPKINPETNQFKASNLLVDNGFFEINTNSLTKPAYTENTGGPDADKNVQILNKLSEDLGVLRQSLLFSGLEVLAHNINRKQKDLKLFEFGSVYKKIDEIKYLENSCLGIWVTGQNQKESWFSENKPIEFHDLSSMVLKLIKKFSNAPYKSVPLEEDMFQYGLSIVQNGDQRAKIGLLNKKITGQLAIEQDVFYAEIDFDGLLLSIKTGFNVEEISKFPEVRRDLSLVIDKSVTFEQIKQVTEDREFAGILKNINVFDYYVGEKIEKDKKAYALSFILQDNTKTLTDRMIDKIMNRLMKKFELNLGAVIRQ